MLRMGLGLERQGLLCRSSTKVIPEKKHPMKNLVRRKNRVHERHEKHEQKQDSFVLFVFFVDDSFAGFIIENHLMSKN